MIENLLSQAKESCRIFQTISQEDKIKTLEEIEQALLNHTQQIIEANAQDIENAKKTTCLMPC